MWKFLEPAPHKQPLPENEVAKEYRKLRLKVFIGIYFGYAAYYLVRKNLSFAVPGTHHPYGREKGHRPLR